MKLFTLFADLSLDSSGFEEGIKKASGLGASFQNNISAISAKTVAMGHALYDAGKQAAKMAGDLVKDVITEYADTEQLLGGVATIFKDDAQTVIDNADRAFRTAGMSANDYMQTVTGFSSSLLQGLNGDTAAAASVADMAIRDMADNANKFGTNIGMIQNAYQGFAKDNYTMLDNLKLGYGGTQEEMARLVNDSGVLGDAIKVTAETVKDVPLDKIFEAIHVIQTEMDITGTTAKEASTTISGSFAAFGAVWQNVLSGLGNKEADMDELMDNLFDSGRTLIENVLNLLPTIGDHAHDALRFVLEEARKAMPQLQETFRDVWDNKLPTVVLKGANGIIGAVNSLFGTNIPAIESIDFPTWDEIKTTASSWWSTVRGRLQTLTKWAIGIFKAPEATAEEMKAAVSGWWSDTARPALESAATWTLNLFGVPTENGDDIAKSLSQWWQDARGYVENACTWALTLFNAPEETAEDVLALVSTWWAGIETAVSDVCAIAYSLAEGDTDAAKDKITTWWENVVTLTKDVLKISFDLIEPIVTDVQTALRTWWDDVLRDLGFTVTVNAGLHTGSSGREHAGGGFRFGSEESPVWVDENGAYGPALPSHATGLSWVPHDNYIARLHAGEAVLTRKQADAWRSGSAGVSTQRIEALLSGILSAVQQPVPAVIDGNSVYGYVSSRMTRDVATRRLT